MKIVEKQKDGTTVRELGMLHAELFFFPFSPPETRFSFKRFPGEKKGRVRNRGFGGTKRANGLREQKNKCEPIFFYYFEVYGKGEGMPRCNNDKYKYVKKMRIEV